MSLLTYLENLLDGIEVEWEELGEVAAINTGQKPSKILDSATDFEYINAGTSRSGYSASSNCNGDTVTTPSRGQGGIGYVGYQKDPFWLGPLCYKIKSRDNTLLINKYIFYFLQSKSELLLRLKREGGVPAVNKSDLAKLEIPIPCPDNPEKSLEIQAEIVRILDVFNTLVAELTTELNMRKKQYHYYQFELLKFTETTQQLSIGECCDIKKGVTPIKKATPGKYPLVATTEERQSSSEYQFDCPAVCVPLISSRGHGVASIDRIYYQDGKFALGNILCAITPNDSEMLSAKFLRYYLFDKKDVLLVPLMRGGANVSLTVDSLKKVKIPIPPKADQQRIVRALDKFDEFVKALPCEIELRQRQYEYYRDLLLNFPKFHSDEAA